MNSDTPFDSGFCFLAGNRCLSGCTSCPPDMHQCSICTTDIGSAGTVVSVGTSGARQHPMNINRARAVLSRWQRSYGPKRGICATTLVDARLTMCTHAKYLLQPDVNDIVAAASVVELDRRPASSAEMPDRCESCGLLAETLKKYGITWRKPVKTVLRQSSAGVWECNQKACKDARRHKLATAAAEDDDDWQDDSESQRAAAEPKTISRENRASPAISPTFSRLS